MLSLAIWWCGILLEALLLFRGLKGKFVPQYPNFYIYVLSLFLTDGLLYVAYVFRPEIYRNWVWYPGFLVLFLGWGIVLEVFRHVFSRYAGVEKFARVGGFFVLGAMVLFAVAYPVVSPNESTAHNLYIRLQRDFLTVQAIILFLLLQLIYYYRIELGRNLKGMILGYGQCVAVTLSAIALEAHIGAKFESSWILVQQLSYLASLVIWLIGLWSYCPDPPPDATIGSDGNYSALASRTRDMVSAAGTQLIKVERL